MSPYLKGVSRIKIEISGLGEADAVLASVRTDVADAVRKAAEAVAEEARRMCPVDTGALRNSITVSSDGSGAEVIAGKDYAVFVEFGTYKTAAQPFLVPALLVSGDTVTDIIKNEIFGPEV